MTTLIASDSYSVILGLGASGLSVARYFAAKRQKFMVIDTRHNPPGLEHLHEIDASIPVLCGPLTEGAERVLEGAREIAISPGLDRRSAYLKRAQQAGVPIVGDIELFLREVKVPVVGITGSNGKTTVTTLVAEVATSAGIDACAAGNIGLPALDALQLNKELYVLELSSFQLESVTKPMLDVACILNISEDHMDRYNSFADYCMAKQKIYHGAKSVVYNLQDKLTQPPIVQGVTRRGFGLQTTTEEYEKQYLLANDGVNLMVGGDHLVDVATLKLFGRHNVANVLAVFAIADALGIERDAVRQTVAEFRGIAHRCEWVARKSDVTFINDSKATNVGAAVAAISGLHDDFKHIVLIAGGEGKGANFEALGDWINRCIAVVILMGKDAEQIRQCIGQEVHVIQVSSMVEAVNQAYDNSREGSLVLLSPACASFDMFTGYEDRGTQFKKCVQELAA